MINCIYILLIHINAQRCILPNTMRQKDARWCDLWWFTCIITMNMRCFYCSQLAQAKQLPRKHLRLSILLLTLDTLHICWEGRTVNQTVTVRCPSVKAKGQKVHENSNLCCNSLSVMHISTGFCMCQSMEDTLLSETHFQVYFLASTPGTIHTQSRVGLEAPTDLAPLLQC